MLSFIPCKIVTVSSSSELTILSNIGEDYEIVKFYCNVIKVMLYFASSFQNLIFLHTSHYTTILICYISVGEIWLFDFCEALACVSGKRQCAKCGLAFRFSFLRDGKKTKYFFFHYHFVFHSQTIFLFIVIRSDLSPPCW